MKLLTICYIFISFNLLGQVCGADEYNKPFVEANPQKYEQTERDIQKHLNGPKTKSQSKIKIPVVFHGIWNDNNENIPDSVIHQQLERLNESFNARNADTTLLTDTLKRWVGNFNIEFELAYLDPFGIPTSGITRTKTMVGEFSYFGNGVKFDKTHGKDPWPTDRYLNIWVCDLYGGLLGYAQFPGGPPEVDGIVIDWQVTGNQIYDWSYSNMEPYIGGRVLVHEVGHWLNLYHPWGNVGTCGDDFIPETGIQMGPVYPSLGCPDTLISTCPSEERVFVKHYMEYCGEKCMVTFTKNQVARGLASLHTYRTFMVENYQPRPVVNEFDDIQINPSFTRGRLYIEFPSYSGKIDIKIYDIRGRIIKHLTTYKRFEEIYLTNPSGIYIINVYHNQERVFNQKIVVSPSSPYGGTYEDFR